jgi:hypothetical protein
MKKKNDILRLAGLLDESFFIMNEGWILGQDSMQAFKGWKESIKKTSQFLRRFDWPEAYKILKNMGLYDYYYEKAMKEEGYADEEWATKMFIRDKSDIILAKVDPCKLMSLRSFSLTKPNPIYYEEEFKKRDYDPNLPLVMVVPKGVVLWDGNHRMQAACNLGIHGYAAIAYFMDYDVMKPAILEIVK